MDPLKDQTAGTARAILLCPSCQTELGATIPEVCPKCGRDPRANDKRGGVAAPTAKRVEPVPVPTTLEDSVSHMAPVLPPDVQLVGTLAMLAGHVAEMATGEGKTLSGALAAAGYALRGRSVHVMPVNDYLARRAA